MKKMQKQYEVTDFPKLSKEQLKMLENLDKITDKDIDTSDTPEATGKGGFYYIQSLKMPQTKIYTGIDTDLLDWLKSPGKGYQKRMNDVIRWARLNGCPLV